MIEPNTLKEGDLIYEKINNQLVMIVAGNGSNRLTTVRLNKGIYISRGTDPKAFEGIEGNYLITNLKECFDTMLKEYVQQTKEG